MSKYNNGIFGPSIRRSEVETDARRFAKNALSDFNSEVVRLDDGSTQIVLPTVLHRVRLDSVSAFHASRQFMHGEVGALVKMGIQSGAFKSWLNGPLGKNAIAGLHEAGIRTDSVGGGIEGGAFFAYQLTNIQGRLADQPYAPLNGRKLFNISAAVGNGAKQYAIRRVFNSGSAQWIDGESEDTRNSAPSVAELVTNVRYASAGFECSILDLASADFGKFQLQENGVKGALRGIQDLDNSVIWNGDSSMNLWGVTAHPEMPEVVCATAFTTSASWVTLDSLLTSFLTTVASNNNSAFQPDHVVFSVKLYSFMAGYKNSLGTMSLLESFKKTAFELYGIKPEDITSARELNGDACPNSPSGEEGMFVYSKANPDDGQIISTGGPTAVPIQFNGMKVIQMFYQGIGGYVAVNPGANLVIWIPLS